MFFFQLPRLPEYVARRKNHALLLEPFERLPPSARWAAYEREVYRHAFEQPGALSAMLNYYRAMFRPSGVVRPTPIDAPVLVLWGEQDHYLGPGLARPGARWAPRARVEYFPDAGHFIQHEQPQAVNERLIQFLNEDRASGVVSS